MTKTGQGNKQAHGELTPVKSRSGKSSKKVAKVKTEKVPKAVKVPQPETHHDNTDYLEVDSVPWAVTENDPGVFLSFASAGEVHAAMVNAPLPAGLVAGQNPDQSLRRLKRWIFERFVGIAPNCRVPMGNGVHSRVAYHNLTFAQYTEFQNATMLFGWAMFCFQNGLSCGTWYGVSGAGPGSVTASPLSIGPFQSQV